MQVIKRDGTKEDVKIEKILHAVNRACRGLSGVEAIQVAKRTISAIHDGSTTEELDDLSISNAVMLMAEEPNYSRVAARMLAESIRKEVGRGTAFRDYMKSAFEFHLINETVFQLANAHYEMIEYRIRHERDDLFEYFGLKTIADRYLLRNPKTRKIIERPQWLFIRVALGLSRSVEEALELYEIVSQFLYTPATPTLFNSGTKHPQMSSCYLLTVSEDSLEGIYKAIVDCARLSKFSGGIGIDWTPVRSNGTLIQGTNGLSNGLIPFLKVLDSSVHAVNQGGKRKGAAAVYLSVWHADIESFLELRNNTGAEERRTHHLNLALWIPDLFMKRVEQDLEWSLFSPSEVPGLLTTYGEEFEKIYLAYEQEGKSRRKLPARALFARMMQTLAETGNGWLCFQDACNLRSAQTGKSQRVIHSSNLCTEILEVTSPTETAVCNLGSINLSSFVDEVQQLFRFDLLEKVVPVAVRFLDRVIDINFYPTQEAKNSNQAWRPIGLGIMGLQDVFFKLKLPFASEEAKKLSAKISETLYYLALQTSMKIAEEEGKFPLFAESRYAQGLLQLHLAKNVHGSLPLSNQYDWDQVARDVAQKGLRNSLLIAIAPTATIASIQGVYESIEPQVSNIFKRETLSGEFLQVNRYLISDLKKLGLWNHALRSKIIEREGSIQEIVEIPAALKQLYKTAWELSQKDLIDMAVDRSVYICQSQSLNLFMEEPHVGKMSSMYMYAWKKGIKTLYYFRSRAKTSIKKTTFIEEENTSVVSSKSQGAVACSLENPESCEACQ